MKYKIQRNVLLTAGYILVLLSGLYLAGCTTDLPKVPPISTPPTAENHPGKFIWHDLMSDNVQADKKFYGELFGWEFDNEGNVNSVYTVIRHNGKPIGGIFALNEMKSNVEYSQWISFLSVDNLDSAVQYTKSNGGAIYRKPFELPERGRLAVIIDPQGAVLSLVKSSSGDPKDIEPAYNEWLWTELWTDDIEGSLLFYNGMIGYNDKIINTKAGTKYYVLLNQNEPRAGVVKISVNGVRPNWLPYIAVKDPSKIVERVKELGGTIILGTEEIEGANAAIIADPSGAVFTIQKWPLDKDPLKEIGK